jgi:hypothetical protein
VEERAGGAYLPRPAEANRPRMDPANVLWFFGTFAIAVSVSVLISTMPESQRGAWRLVVALGFIAAFSAASWFLRWWRWSIPAGLANWLAVATFPVAAISFLRVIGQWPEDAFFDPLQNFSAYPFGVAVATAFVGLVAFAITRFTFILAIVVGAILVAAQLLTPAFESSPSGEKRATMALVAGALVVIAGVFLDAFGQRRTAFWFHALGWFSVAAGPVFFAGEPGGDPERGWIPMLVVGLLLVIVAGPMGRTTWAVYGVLGFYAGIVHYLEESLDEDRWPFALLLVAVGVAIFLHGMVVHRYSRVFAQRFVRRPPPEVH